MNISNDSNSSKIGQHNKACTQTGWKHELSKSYSVKRIAWNAVTKRGKLENLCQIEVDFRDFIG